MHNGLPVLTQLTHLNQHGSLSCQSPSYFYELSAFREAVQKLDNPARL